MKKQVNVGPALRTYSWPTAAYEHLWCSMAKATDPRGHYFFHFPRPHLFPKDDEGREDNISSLSSRVWLGLFKSGNWLQRKEHNLLLLPSHVKVAVVQDHDVGKQTWYQYFV